MARVREADLDVVQTGAGLFIDAVNAFLPR